MPRINPKKGESAFTLAELLITIAIMGVIAIIALPAASNIKKANEDTAYKAYGKSFLIAGKQYNDSYSDDLFGPALNGCAEVTYRELKIQNLIKDIQLDGTTCNAEREVDGHTENSKVRIWKTGDQYDYELFMLCQKDGDIVYSTNNWSNDEKCDVNITPTTPDLPTVGDLTPPKLSVKMRWKKGSVGTTPYDVEDYKSVDALITIDDNHDGTTGLKYPLEVYYQWQFKDSDAEEIEPDEYTGEETEEVVQDEEDKDEYEDDDGDDEDNEGNDDETDVEMTTEDEDDPETQAIVNDTNYENIGTAGKTLLKIKKTGSNNHTTATATIIAPPEIEERDLDGTVRILITPYNVSDNNNNKAIKQVTDTIKIKNDKRPQGTPKTPTCKAYKWKNNNTKPSDSTGLSGYSSGSWTNKNIYTQATGSGSNVDYYFTTRGKTTNVTNTKGGSRNIQANGTSKIKYKACNKGTKVCSKWSDWYIIKLDKNKPKCSISKSNKGTKTGVTLKTVCKDSLSKLSKCAGVDKSKKHPKKSTVTYKKIKKSKTYTVIDRAGNKNTCSKTVTAQKQKRTRSWNSCKTGSSNACVGGYDKSKTYKGVCAEKARCSGGCTKVRVKVVFRASLSCPGYEDYYCKCWNSCKSRTNTCQGGWNDWSKWKTVSSCKKKKDTVSCRTIYK